MDGGPVGALVGQRVRLPRSSQQPQPRAQSVDGNSQGWQVRGMDPDHRGKVGEAATPPGANIRKHRHAHGSTGPHEGVGNWGPDHGYGRYRLSGVGRGPRALPGLECSVTFRPSICS